MRISDWSSDVCSSDLRKENEAAYPVELLLEMKAAHEARILDLLDLGGSPTKGQLARSILPLLEESRQSWAQFGPTSELARSRQIGRASCRERVCLSE